MLLARAGVRVLLVDRGDYGTDTTSTHALMRGAVFQLHRWGLLPAVVNAGTPPVRSTTFSYSTNDVSIAIEPRHGVDALYGPRRRLLDRVLVDAASASGVDIQFGARVDDVVVDDAGTVRGVLVTAKSGRQRVDADVVVGADGLQSAIARGVQAPTLFEGRHATAVLYSYWEQLPVDGYYWRFQTSACIGAIPTNDGATCVFVAIPAARLRAEVGDDRQKAYRRLIRQSSAAFAERLESARMVAPIRGFGGRAGFIKRGVGPGWALVGDSGYFKDPLTAHGITDALRDAEFLARAIIEGTTDAFARYEETRHDLSTRLLEVTDAIASLSWTDEHLQAMHREFSSEMSREVRALAALEPLSCLSSSVSEPPVR